MTAEPDEKKIIVDEDWKSQVETDREDQRHTEQEGAAESSEPIPAPTFESLVVSIATQAMGCMGQMADEKGNPIVDLEVGKHMIDTLTVLEEKTKGNLTTEEASMLENIMHQLHMFYVSVTAAMAGTPLPADKPESDSGIIMP